MARLVADLVPKGNPSIPQNRVVIPESRRPQAQRAKLSLRSIER